MSQVNVWELRAELLDVNGIGEETADSILLYALDKPVFVIDAYTKGFSTGLVLLMKILNTQNCKNILLRI